MNVLAVDPGMSGAVVLVTPAGIQVRRDFKSSADIARGIGDLAPSATVAIIELVSARPGQGVTSMFTFGNAAGVAIGALTAAGFSANMDAPRRLIEVHPLLWQNYIRRMVGLLAGDEFDSLALALKWVPAAMPWLQRKKDHNTADAILMAIWYLAVLPAVGSQRSKRRKRKTRAVETRVKEEAE